MKIVYILKSEINDTLVINFTNNLNKALKPYQKTKKVGRLKISLWTLLCHVQFDDDKLAYDFISFLRSKSGREFIINHFVRNPLPELKKLLAVLPKSCPLYVMGGLALDGYLGKLSRTHNDVDLLCWRKNIKTVKNAIKKIGYAVKCYYFQDSPKKAFYLVTDEENPIMSFNIMDEIPNNSFEISIGKNIHQVFPKKYLGSKTITINDIKFPVVRLELLDCLNKKLQANLNLIKKENPKLYSILGVKIINNKHDRKLLDKLKKK